MLPGDAQISDFHYTNFGIEFDAHAEAEFEAEAEIPKKLRIANEIGFKFCMRQAGNNLAY